MEIETKDGEIYLDGIHAGKLPDCIANYPDSAAEIQASWDAWKADQDAKGIK